MDERTEYVRITESTAYGARDRVLDNLNELTKGQAEMAIKWAQEFLELDKICREFKKEPVSITLPTPARPASSDDGGSSFAIGYNTPATVTPAIVKN